MRSYFKVVPNVPLSSVLFFFDETDCDSIDVAYREAVDCAGTVQKAADEVSVYRMPAERGPWTPGKINRGVAVIGENRQLRTLH